MKLNYGDAAAQEVSGRIGAPALTLTDLKGYPASRLPHGIRCTTLVDGREWRFHSTSVLTADDLLVVAPTVGSGRWLAMPGQTLIAIPITFATADATITLTLQAGMLLEMLDFRWRVTADWTGGASSTIGISSSVHAGATTKGDLLGGAAGDLAAVLVASSGLAANGTIGAQWGTIALRRPVWKSGDTLRHDRITSAYTAGSGFQLVSCNILNNDGA